MCTFLNFAKFSFSKDLDSLKKMVQDEDSFNATYIPYTEEEKLVLFSLMASLYNVKTADKERRKQIIKSFHFALFNEETLKLLKSFIVSIYFDPEKRFSQRVNKYQLAEFKSVYVILKSNIDYNLCRNFGIGNEEELAQSRC